jgi:hypothetical protein
MWDDHAWLVPRIRAALDAKVPPSAIILRDPEHTEYDAWDLKMVAAYHVYNDMMRGSIPIYWDESDRVAFDVKTGVSKSKAALDRKEEQESKKKGTRHGVYHYAVPRTIDGGPLPTLEEWAAEKAAKQGNEKRPR